MSRFTPCLFVAAAFACWPGEARAGFAWLGDWQASGQGEYWTYSDPGKVTGIAHGLFAVTEDGEVDLTRTFEGSIELTRQFEIRDSPDGVPIEVHLDWSGEFGIVPGMLTGPWYSINLGNVLMVTWRLEDYRHELPTLYGDFWYSSYQEATAILPEGIHTARIFVGVEVGWNTLISGNWNRDIAARSLLTATIRPVPEPASIALMGLGCLGLALASRRLTR